MSVVSVNFQTDFGDFSFIELLRQAQHRKRFVSSDCVFSIAPVPVGSWWQAHCGWEVHRDLVSSAFCLTCN